MRTSGEIDPVAAELISQVVAAYADVTSLSGTLRSTPSAAGATINATFDETLNAGVATGLDMNLEVSGSVGRPALRRRAGCWSAAHSRSSTAASGSS